MVSEDSRLPAFHELLLAGFCKSRSRSNFSARCRQFVHLFNNGSHPVASAPDFVCILGNDVVSNLVPGLDHVDAISVSNDVRVSSIDIAFRRNIEQRSVAKLGRAFFDLCREENAVSRDNVEAGLRAEVLLGSFVEGNIFLQIGGLKVVLRVCQVRSHF